MTRPAVPPWSVPAGPPRPPAANRRRGARSRPGRPPPVGRRAAPAGPRRPAPISERGEPAEQFPGAAGRPAPPADDRPAGSGLGGPGALPVLDPAAGLLLGVRPPQVPAPDRRAGEGPEDGGASVHCRGPRSRSSATGGVQAARRPRGVRAACGAASGTAWPSPCHRDIDVGQRRPTACVHTCAPPYANVRGGAGCYVRQDPVSRGRGRPASGPCPRSGPSPRRG